MKINRHNYEQFAIDYLEGQLDATTKASFEAFLLANPDVQEEIDALASFDELMTIEEPAKVLETADLLKMKDVSEEELKILPINEENYEPYVMEYLEGDLSPPIAAGMKGFLATNPQITKEIEGLERITLTPDEAIFFPEKSKLKRNEEKPVFALFRTATKWVLPIAALWAMFFFWNNWAGIGESTSSNPVAVNEPVEEESKLPKKLVSEKTETQKLALQEKEIKSVKTNKATTVESIATKDAVVTTNSTNSVEKTGGLTTKKTRKQQKRFKQLVKTAKQNVENKVKTTLASVSKVNQQVIASKSENNTSNHQQSISIIHDKNASKFVAFTAPVVPSNNAMINWSELPLANNQTNNTASKQANVVGTPSTVKQSNINWEAMPRSQESLVNIEPATDQTSLPKEELMSHQKEVQAVASLTPIAAMEVDHHLHASIAIIEVDLTKINPIKANKINISPITPEGFLALSKAERSPLLPSNSFVASIEDFVPEILAREVEPIKEKSFALALKIPLEKRSYQLVNRFIKRLK